jgi:hypothetical protein
MSFLHAAVQCMNDGEPKKDSRLEGMGGGEELLY